MKTEKTLSDRYVTVNGANSDTDIGDTVEGIETSLVILPEI